MMEWRWNLEGENEKENSRDREEGSEDGPEESQEEGTPVSASCLISVLLLIEFFIFCDLNV